MTDQEFINQIAPYTQKYAKEYGYSVVSPIIAQFCLESAFGRSTLASKYHNYAGLKCGTGWKGPSVNMTTKEEYTTGTLTTIKDNFRVYPNMDAGVKGYFDFIQYPRYSNLRSATTPKQYLEFIKADGYATSSGYVNNNLRIVKMYNLERFDKGAEQITAKNYAGQVTASLLNVRTGPGTGYNVMDAGGHGFQLPKGICIAFDAESGDWGRLAGCGGWVNLGYIAKT